MSEYSWKNINSLNQIPDDFEIRQIYLWIITKDQKIITVSKDRENWQFPGGKPKTGESIRETIIRETKEETGLDISDEYSGVSPFGYYLVTKEEGNSVKQFLQLRFKLILESPSNELVLTPDENLNDPDPIKYVKAVEIAELARLIPWINDVEEYEVIKKVIRES